MNDQSINAYILAAVVAIVFMLIAIVISMAIKYELSQNPKDNKKRRVWFWILGVLTPVVTFLVGFLFMRSNITVPSLRDKFTAALGIATGCSFVFYMLIGFVLSKVFKKSKIGHWF